MSSLTTRLWMLGGVLLGLALAVVWLGDQRLLLLGRNSLLLALGACAIALPLGSLLGLLIGRTDVAGRTLAGWVIAALIFLPLYLHFTGWDAGLGGGGWITSALGRPLDEPLLSGWRGAIFIHGVAASAWVTLIMGLGFRSIEPALEQEALQDSTPLGVLLRVTLPRSWHWAAVAAVWIAVTVTAEMQITDMYQVRTYAEELYLGFHLAELEPADYSQTAQAALVGGLVVLALLATARFAPPPQRTDDQARVTFALGRWRPAGTLLLWLPLLLMLGAPLVNLVVQAGVKVIVDEQGFQRSWSAAKAMGLLPRVAAEFSADMQWSLLIGGAAATCAVAIAAPIAWLARRRGWAMVLLVALAAAALAVPGPLVGAKLIGLFNQPRVPLLIWLYDRTIAAPTAAMTIKALPLVLLLLWRAMGRIGQDTLDSAAVEGASQRQQLLRIGLAGQSTALASAWLLALVLAMGDLAGSILTAPAGLNLMAVRIFTLAHAGVDDQLAAFCLVAEAMFLLLAALVYLGLRKTLWRPG